MATTTVTSVSSTTSSTQVVAADITRSALSIVNTDPNRAYLLQGTGTASSTNYTEYLDENDSIDIDGDQAEQAWQVVWAADGSGSITITQTLTEQLAGASATSILGIIQEACRRIGLEIPDAVYSSTTREHLELKEIANEACQMITRSHRWRKLVQRATYTGDGSTQDFDLPDDFGWMPDDQQVWSSATQIPFLPVRNLDEWLALDVRNFNPGTNAWTIYGGQIHFTPALDTGEIAQHYYQSTASVQPATGTAKSQFTLDTDTFRIDDQLLKLAIVYLWKQHKGLPYAEFLNDYEILKEKLVARDKGATILRQGRTRWPRGTNMAYPLTLPGGT